MTKWVFVLLFAVFCLAILSLWTYSQPKSPTGERTFVMTLTNSTWAGYVVVPTNSYSATFVNASWTVPKVSCPQGRNFAVLIWVGLGGLRADNTTHGLEQIGTRVDCQNGSPIYSTWYELSPTQQETVPLPNIIQKAGDNISASVTYSNATKEFTFVLTSSSSPIPQPFSQEYSSGSLVSAEWIVEAPGYSLNRTYYSMPDFGSVLFSNCFATVGNQTDSITGFGGRTYSNLWQDSYVCIDNSSMKAVPQKVINSGRDFSVTWQSGGTC